MGKPHSREEAIDMLRFLSGREHKVITAVTLRDSKTCLTSSDTAYVYFKELTDNEIEYYIDTYKPFDKAGAYGIQGRGGELVDHYEGDYNNIVGLPVDTLLKSFPDIMEREIVVPDPEEQPAE
jgi:septum formation protein